MIDFIRRQPRAPEPFPEELKVHLRAVIPDASENVTPGVSASPTALLFEDVVDPLTNTLESCACSLHPR